MLTVVYCAYVPSLRRVLFWGYGLNNVGSRELIRKQWIFKLACTRLSDISVWLSFQTIFAAFVNVMQGNLQTFHEPWSDILSNFCKTKQAALFMKQGLPQWNGKFRRIHLNFDAKAACFVLQKLGRVSDQGWWKVCKLPCMILAKASKNGLKNQSDTDIR